MTLISYQRGRVSRIANIEQSHTSIRLLSSISGERNVIQLSMVASHIWDIIRKMKAIFDVSIWVVVKESEI